MVPGRATREGTLEFSRRFGGYRDFYREANGWTVASLGLGTYLGGIDDDADRGYVEAIAAAVRGGINVLDAAINYRHQRSERSIGSALKELFADGVSRQEIVVCTKAGFLTPGAIDRDSLDLEQVAGRMHSMAPEFLADQIERSRENLGLETIDVFYLHNPETQLSYVDSSEFLTRLARAFERLEKLADEGRIGCYGTATWDGYRKSPAALELEGVLRIAREVGGENHRFRFVQLPFNLAMTEAYANRNQSWQGSAAPALDVAAHSGITVVASASMLQGRLAQGLPETLHRVLGGLRTDAQRAVQFARSAPGVAVALVGMGRAEHVAENLELAGVAPLSSEAFAELFQ